MHAHCLEVERPDGVAPMVDRPEVRNILPVAAKARVWLRTYGRQRRRVFHIPVSYAGLKKGSWKFCSGDPIPWASSWWWECQGRVGRCRGSSVGARAAVVDADARGLTIQWLLLRVERDIWRVDVGSCQSRDVQRRERVGARVRKSVD